MPTQPNEQPGEELDLAIQAYASMRHAATVDELESHWKEYLHRLERIWNKLQALYKDHPRWHQWSGRVARDRRIDPLLSYLVNARGAEEHTVASISERRPGGVMIRLEPGTTVEELVSDGRTVVFKGVGEVHTEFVAEHVVPLSVVNRGRTYEPPTSHLGEKLGSPCVLLLAHCGIDYYYAVVCDAEQFFPSDGKR